MKILKYGEGYPKTATCKECKSELEYVLTDIKHYTDSEFPDGNIMEYNIVGIDYIVCPVCGAEIRVESRIIEHIGKKSKKKKQWL
jgi:hypothetical protein